MAQSGITVSTVGVGDGIDVGTLQEIARRGNGRWNSGPSAGRKGCARADAIGPASKP
jgi:hypothetical protein